MYYNVVMKIFAKYQFIIAILASALAPLHAQTVLKPAVLKKIQAAVFEVVVEKLDEGNITYEKKLPLERIPFAIRNDKYLPIGTAFLMNDGKFYSAAHVFSLYSETLYANYYLRDKNGNTWKIDSVTQFATDRDFICFTAAGYKVAKDRGLSFAGEASLNTVVFSVGNALGEGIVIRNGMLTSRTHEEENGAWEWLRFSAAASPGNSGGPLVTEKGDVLGIISKKSENENLNYALPFAETKNSAANTGVVHIPFYYRLPTILTERFYHVLDEAIPLPKSLNEVRKAITTRYIENTNELVHKLREQFAPEAKEGFAKATGAAEMLVNSHMNKFPYTIYLSNAGKWDYARPKDISTYQLGDNGTVNFGSMLGYTFAYVKKPDTVLLKDVVSSPKTYMDYILAASRITRNVAGEAIAITSFGEPCKSEQHVDRFERTWLVNYWELPFVDYMAITYALPMPDGVYALVAIADYGSVLNGHRQDMSFVVDYTFPSYSAELKNWKEYLALPETFVGKQCPLIAPVTLEYTAAHLAITTGSYAVDLPASALSAADDTVLTLSVGYVFNGEKLTQENRSLAVYTNRRAENYRYVFISKLPKPQNDALKSTTENWEQKRDRISPFNEEPYDYEQYTCVQKILYPDGKQYDSRNEVDCLYVLGCELNGQGKKEAVLQLIADVEKAITF